MNQYAGQLGGQLGYHSPPSEASVVSDLKQRITALEAQLSGVDAARKELARLKRMLAAYEAKEES